MKPESELLFACTRQNFLDVHQKTVLDVCSNQEIRWDVVYSTAMSHGVGPLVYSNLLQCPTMNPGIPERVMHQFRLACHRNIVTKEKRATRIAQALAFFAEKSIEVMLIKGAALDILVYGQPWYMISDDVDLVMKCREKDITDQDNTEIMEFLHGRGIECDYFEHHDVILNGVLPIDFQRIWDNATRIKFEGQNVSVMSPEDMLLTTCTDSCRKRFFRLKCLCDIAEIINKYDGLKWEELTKNARQDHCNNIVYTALFATKTTVGCKLPEEVLDNLGVSPARAAIIRRLVRYLSQSTSLPSPHPLLASNKFGSRQFTLSLILVYATHPWYQVWRRIRMFCL